MVIYEFEVDFKKSFIWRSNLCSEIECLANALNLLYRAQTV